VLILSTVGRDEGVEEEQQQEQQENEENRKLEERDRE